MNSYTSSELGQSTRFGEIAGWAPPAIVSMEQTQQWVQALDQYQRAIELYRGPYLADDLYEEWTLSLRQQFQQQFVEALSRPRHATPTWEITRKPLPVAGERFWKPLRKKACITS